MNRNEPWAEEAEAYYDRNHHAENAFKTDALQEYLLAQDLRGKKILDVGCFTGARIAQLAANGAQGFGIEPSSKAVADGKKLHQNISLEVGFSHDLPFEDASFDIVIIHLVLCVVSRNKLLETVAEVDRVLVNGGMLIVGDFYPQTIHRRPWKHREGLFTYKQNYWEIFTASALYSVIDQIKYATGELKRDDTREAGDATSIEVILRKSLSAQYPLREI